jgi:23S rRNA pseudoU1915 N3-methylase RlmH
VALAAKLKAWQLENDDVALVIGGPDGLDPASARPRTSACACRT